MCLLVLLVVVAALQLIQKVHGTKPSNSSSSRGARQGLSSNP
jgi:hypothetical protein